MLQKSLTTTLVKLIEPPYTEPYVVLTEFNQKRYEDSIRTEGALSQLFKSICRGRMTIEEGIHDAAEDFQMSEEEFLSCFKSYQMNAENSCKPTLS